MCLMAKLFTQVCIEVNQNKGIVGKLPQNSCNYTLALRHYKHLEKNPGHFEKDPGHFPPKKA